MVEGRNSFGRYFKDFVIDKVYKHWPGKTVTEADNHLFSLLTMNHHPLHFDAHFATRTQHKRNLVGAPISSDWWSDNQ